MPVPADADAGGDVPHGGISRQPLGGPAELAAHEVVSESAGASWSLGWLPHAWGDGTRFRETACRVTARVPIFAPEDATQQGAEKSAALPMIRRGSFRECPISGSQSVALELD
jgi:hypothetical protein